MNQSKDRNQQVELEDVIIDGEPFFKISNHDTMRPFFMSIVSDSDHWMFISSNGGLTAGRKNAEYALFPYYTDDKITATSEITGSKSIFRVQTSVKEYLWEPFSKRFEGVYTLSRNIYKNKYGNKVIFEENNHDLKLTFRYMWANSKKFGFIRQAKLTNQNDEHLTIHMVDGVQNIMPYGVNSDLQNNSSNLVSAYKRNELEPNSGMGIYALSAIIVDKAEPSEALKANVAWSYGIDETKHLLSSLQLQNFRDGLPISEEQDIKAENGAYLISSHFDLKGSETREWTIACDVNLSPSQIISLSRTVTTTDDLDKVVKKDIQNGVASLIKLTAASDGLQQTSDALKDARHYSNTLFNIMRGGIFDNNYIIEKWDFQAYLQNANIKVAERHAKFISSLSETFKAHILWEEAEQSSDADFTRLCLEYLPLKFSRRHGDPSRPWNKFSINLRDENDGSKILDYEGNWRDIFQNWEALAHSYPEFIFSMIFKFLNASTFDGYNPYRVTKSGFDWEAIEPDDPWSYIGYWGDHQVIYLLKFLEFAQDHFPEKLADYFNADIFVYANVPYKIRSYEAIVKDAKDTIDFDHKLDQNIRQKREKLGADGALLDYVQDGIIHVSFIEKTLAMLLAKLSNFVPEGGIWMNTQRPEWNDANNALVGNGISMVTLYYIRRFLSFFDSILSSTDQDQFSVSAELSSYFQKMASSFNQNEKYLTSGYNDVQRRAFLDQIGQAASEYRNLIYEHSFSGEKATISKSTLTSFVNSSLRHLEHTITANRREDHLFHSYNLLTLKDSKASIAYLSEMLEGQVAVLSSKYLKSEEVVKVLDAVRTSQLYRPDQNSYLLYPNKDLKGFLARNIIPSESVQKSELLQTLLEHKNHDIIEKDITGAFHFNGKFSNAKKLEEALHNLSDKGKFTELIGKESQLLLDIYEEVFNHKAFTGRSGTFYGYEGLGSIYWHMVSKYLLAVMECFQEAIKSDSPASITNKIMEHFYEINEGIGVHKNPSIYGAFPTDPYSHTPFGKGAQQPGMTGQVKEDIISRFGELGVKIKDGQLHFAPKLLRSSEFLQGESLFEFIDVNNEKKSLKVEKDALCFTYCQVPVLYRKESTRKVIVHYKDGNTSQNDDLFLSDSECSALFQRTGEIHHIEVYLPESMLNYDE